jgi:diaminopimelate epimerase
MQFTKMHGIGNDFIVVDAFHNEIENPSALAKRICSRHFGIGSDGLILMCPSDRADATMRIFNSDGSEPEMCGNGIRCAAKFLYDMGLVRKTEMTIDTLAGIKPITLQLQDGRCTSATVDMGEPELTPAKIPVAAESNRIRVELGGREVEFFCVSMGNPHAVTFDLFPDDEDFLIFGRQMENHPLFPAKANIEFCRVEGADARVRVWERGDGATLGCGTGACAVLAAGVRQGLLPRTAGILLPGGALSIRWDETGNHLFMTGPAETVFTGEIEQ